MIYRKNLGYLASPCLSGFCFALYLTSLQYAHAADFTQFLSQRNFSVVKETAESKPGQTLLEVADEHLNPYLLQISSPLTTYSLVTTSILTEAMGLTNLEAYPILVKPGMNGVPQSSAGQNWIPAVLTPAYSDPAMLSEKRRQHEAKGQNFFETTANYIYRQENQPYRVNENTPNSKKPKLSPEAKAQLIFTLALKAILGDEVTKATKNENNQIIAQALQSPFANYSELTQDKNIFDASLAQSLSEFPAEEWNDFLLEEQKPTKKSEPGFLSQILGPFSPRTEKEFEEMQHEHYAWNRRRFAEFDLSVFIESLNAYVSRLEQTPQDTLKALFDPVFHLLNRERKASGQPEIEFEKILVSRIQRIRSELVKTINASAKTTLATKLLSRPVKIEAPHIHLPLSSTGRELLTNSKSQAPVNMLWAYFFEPSISGRTAIELKIKTSQDLSNSKDPILELSNKAEVSDPTIYFVAKYVNPFSNIRDYESFTGTRQVHLNPINASTMVVVPPNDLEARKIADISHYSGAIVHEIRAPHGTKLDEQYAAEIISHAKRKKLNRIVIVELPEARAGIEDSIRKAGFELKIVDHHTYQGQDRYKRLSSLEQTAQILGYKLGIREKMVGVMDRAFWLGLADLGVPQETVLKFAETADGGWDLLQLYEQFKDRKPIETKFGRIYVVEDLSVAQAAIVGAFAMMDYPKLSNVLMIGRDQIRFSGSPEIINELEKIVAPHKKSIHAVYSGGDKNRSMFWGAKGIPQDLFTSIRKAMSENLELSSCGWLLEGKAPNDGPSIKKPGKFRF